MTSWKTKATTAIGEHLGRDLMKRVSDFSNELENWTSKNPLNAKNANPVDEDEYMRDYGKKTNKIPLPSKKPSVSNFMPMQRDVSTWSKVDLDSVMQSKNYYNDGNTQKKVRSYFDWKYPGKQKLDATGRPY